MRITSGTTKWLWAVALAAGLGSGAPINSTRADVVVHIGVGEPPPRPVVYHYQYYPDSEVYFVPETRVYWWQHDGAWVSGPRVPEGIALGGGVALDVDAPEPWHHHEIIIKRYPHRGEIRREEKRDEREDRHEERREEHRD